MVTREALPPDQYAAQAQGAIARRSRSAPIAKAPSLSSLHPVMGPGEVSGQPLFQMKRKRAGTAVQRRAVPADEQFFQRASVAPLVATAEIEDAIQSSRYSSSWLNPHRV